MSLTDEQKALRKTGIGGSEISAILGLNPFAGPLDIYLAKVEGVEIVPSFHMERGTFLEAGIAEWYASRTGATLREVGTIRHPQKPIVLCTPDRLAKTATGEIDLSIKCPARRGKHWGESGTDDVSDHVNLQVQWELIPLGILYGIRLAHIAAPLDGDLSVFEIRADAEIQGAMMDAAQAFWTDFVLAKKPPPIDGSESWTKRIASLYPRNNGEILSATPEAERWATVLNRARLARKEAEKQEEEAKNRLKDIMKSADSIEGKGWSISHRLVKGRARVEWEEVAREAGAPEHLVQKHTRIGEPSRRFVPRFEESGNGE